MSKIQKAFTYLAFISMLWVLASCSTDVGSNDKPSSSGAAMVSLGCTNLQTSVVKGGTIAKPNLICNNGRTAEGIIWNGLPGENSWKVDPNTYAPDFVISVSAFCGSVELEDVPCGTVEVIEAAVSSSSRAGGSSNSAGTGSSSSVNGGSSSSVAGGSSSSRAGGSSSSVGGSSNSGAVLTCTGLQETVAKGGTIAIPTLACTNDATPTGITWTGRPSGSTATSWPVSATTQSTSYTISVNATCGSAGIQSGVRCGTVNIVAAGLSSSAGGGSSSSVGGNSSSSDAAASSSSSDAAASSSSSDAAASSSGSEVESSSSSEAGDSSSSAQDNCLPDTNCPGVQTH